MFVLCAQLPLADSLFAHGYLEAARIEYLRGFFFHPELKRAIEPRLNYAITVLSADESEGIAELIGIVDSFPELPPAIVNRIAVEYIRAGRYYLAINLLNAGSDRKMLGLALLLDDQLIEARNTFVRNEDHVIAAEIDSFLCLPARSEKTALLLSLFLPGSGQVYASDVRQGLVDFLINIGSAYLLYNAFDQKKYVDASLVFFFLINRFYLGSLHNAQKAANEYNESRRREWLNHFLDSHFDSLELNVR
ncbi:MAG: hypothetical protein JSU64_02400 [candidate division WOR-3 bacterium]|nr:MAG: hypothetical protein JSU64_02400 [candidate division WOR-3 bacterium]